MLQSHASLRDDFAVSTPQLDLLVALGDGTRRVRCPAHRRGLRRLHRRTGSRGRWSTSLADAVARDYVAATGLTPMAFPVHAAAGAGSIR